MAEKFMGGPVGIDTMAAALGEPRDALEDIVEPFLIQLGFVNRTPRGRVLMPWRLNIWGWNCRAVMMATFLTPARNKGYGANGRRVYRKNS